MILTSDRPAILARLLIDSMAGAHLFVNDAKHGQPLNLADYEEAAGNGYAPIVFQPGDWKQDADGYWTRPALEWAFTGPLGLVYGWYLRLKDGKVFAAETFASAPEEIRVKGDKIRVPLKLRLT